MFLLFIGIHQDSQSYLLKIAQALSLFGLALRLAQRRQQHPGEYRNNGDNDEKLNQCEPNWPPKITIPQHDLQHCLNQTKPGPKVNPLWPNAVQLVCPA